MESGSLTAPTVGAPSTPAQGVAPSRMSRLSAIWWGLGARLLLAALLVLSLWLVIIWAQQ